MRFAAGLVCGIVGTMGVFVAGDVIKVFSRADRMAPLAACDADKPEVFPCLPKWPPSRP